MNSKLLGIGYAAILACTPACGEPTIAELQTNTFKLMDKQPSRALYFATGDEAVLAEYSRGGRDAPKTNIVLYVRKMGQNVSQPMIDSSLKTEFTGDFNADIIINACGDDYGDDDCDQFSRMNERLKVGGMDKNDPHSLNDKEKAIVKGYFSDINKLLAK